MKAVQIVKPNELRVIEMDKPTLDDIMQFYSERRSQ